MYHVSAQGVDEHMINVHYYYHDFDTVLCCSSHQADAFMKAYPNFVNFFENTKETIIKCDQNNPRFHAFLKVCGLEWSCAIPRGHSQQLWRDCRNDLSLYKTGWDCKPRSPVKLYMQKDHIGMVETL